MIKSELNVGLVGHVDHGKTSLVEQLSGKWTDTHSEELKRGITIRLGYADVEIRKCLSCGFFTVKKNCPKCKKETEIRRVISLVDAPGHESLMATMLCGAAIMDAALLLIAANEKCPQPQTKEHLMALQICGIKNIIVVQNKIDLISKEEAKVNYLQIKEFLKGTEYSQVPIIPLSAKTGANLDSLLKAMDEFFPRIERDKDKPPRMLVARSFDVNKPGTVPENLVGGVLGGSLKQGVLKVGQEIEIVPGYSLEKHGRKTWIPLKAKILDLMIGNQSVEEMTPGGTFGLLTDLDPSLAKGDSLTGSLVGLPGKLPPLQEEVSLKPFLLVRVVGLKEETEVRQISKGEVLMLNANTTTTVGIVNEAGREKIKCSLKKPLPVEKGERVAISRRIGERFRLIGYGEVI